MTFTIFNFIWQFVTIEKNTELQLQNLLVREVVREAHGSHVKDAGFMHTETVETCRSVCLSK